MFTKGDPSLPHAMTSVPGSSVLFRLKGDRGLTRDSTWESSRQTFPDTRPGTEPGPLAVRKQRVLTTGLPENPPSVTLLSNIKIRFNFYLNFKYLLLAVLCGVFSSCAELGWPSWWCSGSACSGLCGGWALGSWASVAVRRGP